MEGIKHHLAIPAKNVVESLEFYSSLGCRLGRFEVGKFGIVDFFGMQLVVHESTEWNRNPKMYPRHLGIIFSKQEFEAMWTFALQIGDIVWKSWFTRYKETPQEHDSFFIQDPSNNLIEFKYYKDPRMI